MSLVFWIQSEKKLNELVYVFGAENISFDMKNKKTHNIVNTLVNFSGFGFVKRYARKIDESILIYSLDIIRPKIDTKKIVSLQIVDENTEIEKMRKHVVTSSTNQNFIRKLFIADKKVSLYNPNLKENLNIIFTYDFEYLFLDCFQDCVVWPNKEVTEIPKSKNGQVVFKDLRPKMAKMIGYDFNSFLNSISWLRRYRALGKLNRDFNQEKFVPSVSAYFSVYYYNFLSLSYLCRNYCVTSVQEKDAHQD